MSQVFNHTATARPVRLRMPYGRQGWLVAALALVTAGAALNWGWLTAIGVAPLLLSFAPCAAMCAAGVCMMSGSKACSTKTTTLTAGSNPADTVSTLTGRTDT